MGRCWPGAKLLENGRMRDAVLNETLFLELDRKRCFQAAAFSAAGT